MNEQDIAIYHPQLLHDQVRKQADAMMDHAMNRSYSGPAASGDTFAGWPLIELARATFPNNSYAELIPAVVELKSKFGALSEPALNRAVVSRDVEYTAEAMLAMRMRWPSSVNGLGWARGFAHVAVHNIGDKTHVWVITKDAQSLVLEDDVALFPSDALITKLNMLKG